jgi:capsular exopolysaccharide synthesis family protein
MSNFDNRNNDASIQKQVEVYLKKWPWFVISVIICISLAFLYLRYATEQYSADASVMIKDTSSGGVSETWALGDLDVLGSSFNTVENEIEIISSDRLMKDVVQQLRLHVQYIKKGRFKSADLYKESPVRLTVLSDSLLEIENKGFSINLKVINSSTYEIQNDLDESWSSYNFGSIINHKEHKLLFTYRNDEKSKETLGFNESLNIRVSPLDDTAAAFAGKLMATKIDKRSSVIELSITDSNIEKTEDVLNTLIEVYNLDAIADKNAAAQNTANFIDERLKEVNSDLDSIEKGIQSFKNNKRLTDLQVESLLGLEESAGIGREVINVQTEVQIAEALQRSLFSQDAIFLPSGLSLKGANLESVITTYNTLLSEYLELKASATSQNPSLIRLDSKLEEIRQSIKLSLDNHLSQLRLRQKSLKQELNSISGKISSVPENERLNRDIERTRRVVEAIYLLLSEKKETTAISLAITTPKGKVVDYARASQIPIFPKRNIVLLASFIVGLLIPFSLVYLITLFYNKIESRIDVEKLLKDAAILGEIPKLDKAESGVIIENDRSILAESFRIIRTNLQYIISSTVGKKAPVILVTSTIKGEGKTFVSYNLASTLAHTGKKVVLVGGDIRNPQIHRYVERSISKSTGLTEFIVNDTLEVSDLIIHQKDNPNFDLILSGTIPPNPAEILLNDRVGELLDQLKQEYDYVIIDSAPTILITDTFLINKYADVTVYVTRANYTDKELIKFLDEMIVSKKLENVSVVINNVKIANFGYGRRYTYDYTSGKKTTWVKLKTMLGFKAK